MYETELKVEFAQLESGNNRHATKFLSYDDYFHFLTVRGQDSPRFHVEAGLPFRNREMDYYASVPTNNLKSRLRAKFSYICCIFSHEASTSGYCSRELKRDSKVVYSFCVK